jgi:hypothetical protein
MRALEEYTQQAHPREHEIVQKSLDRVIALIVVATAEIDGTIGKNFPSVRRG